MEIEITFSDLRTRSRALPCIIEEVNLLLGIILWKFTDDIDIDMY